MLQYVIVFLSGYIFGYKNVSIIYFLLSLIVIYGIADKYAIIDIFLYTLGYILGITHCC